MFTKIICKAFKDILKRNVDNDNLKKYTYEMKNGMTEDVLRNILLNSKERKNIKLKNSKLKKLNIKPCIVCIAKGEQKYIIEFVRYHLKLGFKKIYLYDNEDEPTYNNLLSEFGNKIIVYHLPGKYSHNGPQYHALNLFTKIMCKEHITHIIHIDIDEFITLKKHANIIEFINQYIKTEHNQINCGGIGINWRFFGDCGKKVYENIPSTLRFTKREKDVDQHVKTLFNKEYFKNYNTCHDVTVNDNNYPIKSTNGLKFEGPFNPKGNCDIIQLNHYKTKTLSEFKEIRKRGRADLKNYKKETDREILNSFNAHNKNDVVDKTAYRFYKNYCS